MNKRDTIKELKKFLNDNKLNEKYGVIYSINEEYQELTFCKGNIDGMVRIYYDDVITVDYQIFGKEFKIGSTFYEKDKVEEYLLDKIRG